MGLSRYSSLNWGPEYGSEDVETRWVLGGPS